ncbi:MAG: IS1182 family transposase, partial [Candidatus Sedimenticola sp. (ex Thyasira tokunagai)]
MPNFIPYNYDQSAMVVINFKDQLQPGTFEYALHHLVENKLDLSVFYTHYKNEGVGRSAYDPAILLKIILFAYSKGIKSSREIQWCCENNIIFKALSCDTVPHFTTIAAFVSEHPEEIEAIFEQIVLICDQEGLLGKELFAIDGCKMTSNASKEWSGTLKELEEKRNKIKWQITHHLQEHKRTDKSEARDEEKRKRSEQAIETLNKAFDKIDNFLKSASPRMGQGKRPKEVKSNITDNESCKMTTSKGTLQGYNGIATADKKHQVIVDASIFGEGQEHHTLVPILEKVKQRFSNLKLSKDIYKSGTIVTADTGFANESNNKYLHEHKIDAYIPDNKFRSRDPKFADQKTKYGKRHQAKQKKNKTTTIAASEFTHNPTDKTCTCPAGHGMWLRSESTDNNGNHKQFFEGCITHCRTCSLKHRCMRNPEAADRRKGHGRQVSFIIEREKRPNYTDWMKARIDSDKGKLIYSHRMSVVEPVFGNIESNKRLDRFTLRGKKKVQGQWCLYCMVHNIEKLANYGELA